MRIAFIHQLPLEIYPPAANALRILADQAGWEVRAWSSADAKGLPECRPSRVVVSRPAFPGMRRGWVARLVGLAGFVRWHVRVARELARWRPDAIISVEPHSALAVWIYFRLLRGAARLLIHHHEYYTPGDFLKPGNRTSRICHFFETIDLFGRAEWVSQTNATRLRLQMTDCAAVTGAKGRQWPNYPPREWVARAGAAVTPVTPLVPMARPLRLVCVGSLSFEDTFIREVAEWVAARPGAVSLHVCGHNVRSDVWQWLGTLGAPNIFCQPTGCAYTDLPELLVQFDVALVLYKGNTLNFIHNVPNKAVEALVCGLEVWYPREMAGMRDFQTEFPELPLREVNFQSMDPGVPAAMARAALDPDIFTAERAIEPLLQHLRQSNHS